MPLESDFKELQESHRRFLVAYTILTEKQTKNKSVEARKHLKDIMRISKDLRQSIQEYVKGI